MHPIAIQIGKLTIHWYGVMIAIAFLAGLWTATLRARREKIPAEKIADVTLWLMIGAILGARIVYVTTYWKEEFAGQPFSEVFMIQHGGLVYYGGLIGAAIAGAIYIRWKKMPFWKTADVLAPSIALGSFFGRAGCLLNGCCFGKPANLPWAIQFPNGSAAWSQQFQQGLPGVGPDTPSLPVHPTEIYDGLLNLALYFFLAWLFRRKKFDGQIFATYLLCYAVTRSFVEYFRGDYTDLHYHLGLTPAQWVSVPIFVAGLALAAILAAGAEARIEDGELKMATTLEIHPPSSIRHSRPVFIAGPTAVGKSEIAFLLAEKIGGEIISADSMQVYRGLDIGTAKPPPAERARVPHHLIDICDLAENFDAAQFIRLAQKAVEEIQSRNKVPIFCGGTGLYFKAYLSGLGEAPGANSELRAELESASFESLLKELRERDPAAYEKIDKQNPRRVIRAVEVIRLTGKKFSEQRAEWKRPNEDGRLKLEDGKQAPSSILHHPSSPFLCLTRRPADLHARINARVDAMFARGLVDETRELLQRGLEQNKTAMQAIGYRQVAEHLRGELSLAETIEQVKSRTRQFAKRQLTWFRRQLDPEWIELKPEESLEEIARKITLRFF